MNITTRPLVFADSVNCFTILTIRASQLESHGIKFGAHQNAYTSFEETVYELHVPADQPALLGRSLRVLRQLALEVTPTTFRDRRNVVLGLTPFMMLN